MAFDFNNLPKDLGLIVLNGIDYRILTITEYPIGKQVIELLNMTNGEKERMIYYKPNFDFAKNY